MCGEAGAGRGVGGVHGRRSAARHVQSVQACAERVWEGVVASTNCGSKCMGGRSDCGGVEACVHACGQQGCDGWKGAAWATQCCIGMEYDIIMHDAIAWLPPGSLLPLSNTQHQTTVTCRCCASSVMILCYIV